ncbi:MAG: hypothetical protein J07HX5_01263 [halophilic archaeon J07HX5]|nr:MAG: hypothetical protein J07HX5_01263 [halophilic archaeon J07HX5]
MIIKQHSCVLNGSKTNKHGRVDSLSRRERLDLAAPVATVLETGKILSVPFDLPVVHARGDDHREQNCVDCGD